MVESVLVTGLAQFFYSPGRVVGVLFIYFFGLMGSEHTCGRVY